MLRISQNKAVSRPAVMQEESAEQESAVAEPRSEFAKVSPESARYFGPEYRCASCVHFVEPGEGRAFECEIVAGEIDPDGVCGLYDPDADALGNEEEPEEVIEEE